MIEVGLTRRTETGAVTACMGLGVVVDALPVE